MRFVGRFRAFVVLAAAAPMNTSNRLVSRTNPLELNLTDWLPLIAVIRFLCVGAVKLRVFRAVRILRKRLIQTGITPE
jgi:hypothetical protein